VSKAGGAVGLLVALLVAACGSTTPAPAAEALPTFPPEATATLAEAAPTASAVSEANRADRIWLEQPFGAAATLAVYFYSDNAGQPCLRLLISTATAPVEHCAAAGAAVVAVQTTEAQSDGALYTIIAARALAAPTVVVTVALADDEALPVPIDDGGAILILPGARRAVQAVPIDERGNLTGPIFQFPVR
jgi:hypothetical protein